MRGWPSWRPHHIDALSLTLLLCDRAPAYHRGSAGVSLLPWELGSIGKENALRLCLLGTWLALRAAQPTSPEVQQRTPQVLVHLMPNTSSSRALISFPSAGSCWGPAGPQAAPFQGRRRAHTQGRAMDLGTVGLAALNLQGPRGQLCATGHLPGPGVVWHSAEVPGWQSFQWLDLLAQRGCQDPRCGLHHDHEQQGLQTACATLLGLKSFKYTMGW